MTISINRETFRSHATEWDDHLGMISIGTIEAKVAGKTVTANARLYQGGDIFLQGFVGRYRTGNKNWRATVSFAAGCDDKPAFAYFGRDDRAWKFQKSNLIWFDPEAYSAAR